VRAAGVGSEGEYLVCVVDLASRKLVAFSDFMCRLPLYWYADSRQLLLARESQGRSGPQAQWTVRSDRPARQVLSCSFPLGDRTLYEGVKGARPVAYWSRPKLRGGDLRTSVGSYFECNFDDKGPLRHVGPRARVHSRRAAW